MLRRCYVIILTTKMVTMCGNSMLHCVCTLQNISYMRNATYMSIKNNKYTNKKNSSPLYFLEFILCVKTN